MTNWVQIKKRQVQRDEPVVTISEERIRFNASFKKLADLVNKKYVVVCSDDDEQKISFEFSSIKKDYFDAFKVLNRKSDSTLNCPSLLAKKWVAKIAKLKGQNVFNAVRDGSKWIITLSPSFENIVQRSESNKIPQNVIGIYQYIHNGNIVYIGKGEIRNRLNSEERKDWEFNTIEYSEIKGSDSAALEWESFWIEKFKDKNKGHLPKYNLISGKTKGR